MNRSAALAVLTVLITAAAPMALAGEQTGQADGAAAARTFELLNARELEAEPRGPVATRPPDCVAPMTAERKAGIAAGSLVGIVAGLLIADAGDDSEQIAGGVVGAAAGGTLGDLTARALSEPGCEPGPRRTRSATAPQVGHADTSHRTYDRFMREKAREKRD